jgi:hypothetical protein
MGPQPHVRRGSGGARYVLIAAGGPDFPAVETEQDELYISGVWFVLTRNLLAEEVGLCPLHDPNCKPSR